MGAAALTARIRQPVAARSERAASCGLAFDELGGPLVAVCGLVGGSGASTLAFLVARQAARESAVPVLLTESDGSRAGLAVLAGHATELCVRSLADRVAADQAPAQSFIDVEPGFRLVASAPRRVVDSEPEHLVALLCDARAAHGLVVVDCGSAWPMAGPVLEAATHVIWTARATPAGVARARMLVTSDALPAPGPWHEVLAAVAIERRPKVRVRELRQVAAQRCERMVLAPHSGAIARGDLTDASVALGRTLTGVAPILRRIP